jgi:hypothetical protein
MKGNFKTFYLLASIFLFANGAHAIDDVYDPGDISEFCLSDTYYYDPETGDCEACDESCVGGCYNMATNCTSCDSSLLHMEFVTSYLGYPMPLVECSDSCPAHHSPNDNSDCHCTIPIRIFFG